MVDQKSVRVHGEKQLREDRTRGPACPPRPYALTGFEN